MVGLHSMINWIKRLFGPTTRTRLLDQLDLQARQGAEDRRQFRDLLLEFQILNERQHLATVKLVDALASSVTESGKSFNRYIDLITPKGEPQVRVMTDAAEAAYEKQWREARPDLSGLEQLGEPINSPIIDQLAHQDVIAGDIAELVRSLGV